MKTADMTPEDALKAQEKQRVAVRKSAAKRRARIKELALMAKLIVSTPGAIGKKGK